MRAIVVDDEPLARRRLTSMLDKASNVEVVGECESAEGALELLADAQPDVVFLDIQMPGLGGLGLAEKLNASEGPAVVFVTAHSEHALEAFELAAADYLLKPFSKERLAATLARIRDRVEHVQTSQLATLIQGLSAHHYADRLPIPGRSRVVFVDVSDIDRIEADGNYVTVHAGGKNHLLRSSLSEMESRLDPARFVRIHRSHLVCRDRISELRTASTGAHHIVLKNGEQLPVGRTYASAVLG